MKGFLYSCIIICFLKSTAFATGTDSSFTESAIVLHTAAGDLNGSLTLPIKNAVAPVALIIAGSGPTDRNGNNPVMKNNSLQQIAYALAEAGIASVRYDKRGIAKSEAAGKKEEDLRFENYINDAGEWIDLLKKDGRFSKIIVIGHSEGSLIGMIVAKKADKYISVAGAGRSADIVLKEQLSMQPETTKNISYSFIDSLKAGIPVNNTDPSLNMLFRKSIQAYMISWFKYDPQVEIKKLTIPVLIIQGTNDLQVKAADASSLAKANPAAKLLLVEKMNHVLKIVNGDQDENVKAYNDPSLPIATELKKAIIDFIKAG